MTGKEKTLSPMDLIYYLSPENNSLIDSVKLSNVSHDENKIRIGSITHSNFFIFFSIEAAQ